MEPYPDYQLMLSGLPDPTTFVIVSGTALRRTLLEILDADHITMAIADANLSVAPARGTTPPVVLPATVHGTPMTIGFALTTLYPPWPPPLAMTSYSTCVPRPTCHGRSADEGDLITLVMPVDLTAVDPMR